MFDNFIKSKVLLQSQYTELVNADQNAILLPFKWIIQSINESISTSLIRKSNANDLPSKNEGL